MVATRFVVHEIGPAGLALLRYLIGVACLAPFALLGERVRFAGRDIVPIGVLGILQFGVLIALLNVGLRAVPAGPAALIFSTFPLLTMLFAAALGHEALSRAKSIGVLLTILGVGLALGERLRGAVYDGAFWLGALMVLASAALGAICSVLYRPYLRKYPALPVGAFAMLASVGFLALLAAGEGSYAAMPHLSGPGWLAILFIGFSSGVGYFLWLWALKHASATRVTVFLSLSPVTAAALGALFLGETVSTTFLAGLAAVALGLWFAHRP